MLTDELLDEATLVTGEDLRKIADVQGNHRTVSIDGRRLLGVRTNGVVRFVPPRDLSPFNVLVVHLQLAEPFDGSMVTRLDFSTQSPGMAGHDSRFSVLHFNQPGPWKGWQRVIIPAENLVASGFPDDWKHVRSITLDVHSRAGGGTVIFGDIELLAVRRPRGPRMTDEELLDALDLERPDMSRVARHAEAGRTDKALAAFAAVMRRTKRPQRGEGRRATQFGTEAADAICRHRIMNQQLPRRIDWQGNPIGYLEWNHAFNRQTWMVSLVNGFFEATAAGKKQKYARKLDYLLRSWCEQNPEPVGHNGGLDPAWETLSTSIRINWTWPHVLAVAATSEDVTDRTLIAMAKMIHAHAEHLLRYGGHHNWFISESTAILTASVLVPQFRRAPHWAKAATTRLTSAMEVQVFNDGVQYELSPGYHGMTAGLFEHARTYAKFGGHDLSDAFTTKLATMFDFLALIRRPDGTFPVPNDAGACLRTGDSWLAAVGRKAKRSDWLWAGTGGAEGRPPRAGSVHFADAGYAVMRSGWDHDDRWAFFDMGEFGAGHQHEDKLQVELYAYGTPFLIDPGISSYQHDPVVEHFRCSAAHNSIQVDGLGQVRKLGPDYARYIASSRGKNLWAAGRELDMAEGVYDEPYGPQGGKSYIASQNKTEPKLLTGITHTRALVFARPDYWLIIDTVTGRGEHTLDALWHFAPMLVRADAEAFTLRTSRVGKPNLELICRGDWAGGTLAVVTGRESPSVQGFAALDGEIKPIPCGIVSRKARLPFHGVTIAAPYATGTDSGFAVDTEPVTGTRGEGLLITVARPSGLTDRFLWRHTGTGALATANLRADARFAGSRTNTDGVITYAALVDGRSLAANTVTLKGKAGDIAETGP